MPKLTGEEILAALMENPEYSAQPEPVLEAMKPFILAIPQVLKTHLDKTVSLKTILDAKVAFLRYCSKNNFVTKVVQATPDEALGMFDKDELTEMFESLINQFLEVLPVIVEDVDSFLKRQGVSEVHFMSDPNGIALKPDLLRLYKAGTLTIRDVLRLQPSVITKNTDNK